MSSKPASSDAYLQLVQLLARHHARHRWIEHAAEGVTEIVSALRGHPARQAAKCIVLMVKIGKRTTRFVLAVVPGDARVDLAAVKRLLQGTYVAFASTEVAERLAGSATGTILPFTFDSQLELIVDPTLLEHDEIYFNAARLDRSLALAVEDYRRIARPRVARIATAGSASERRVDIETTLP